MPLNYAVLSPEGDVEMAGSLHDCPEALALVASLGAVTLTDAQAAVLGRSPKGWRMAPDGTLGPRPEPTPPLAVVQAAASTAVDGQAEAARLRYLTPGSGQALVYQAKKDEADAFFARFADQGAASAATASDFPMLFSEAGITAPDAWGVAEMVRSTSRLWMQVAAAIETVRLTAKAAIAAAATPADVQAALAAVAWPAP